MSNRTVRTSVSIDTDIIDRARERSKDMNQRFPGEENLSGYINALIRRDLGMPDKPNSKAGPENPRRLLRAAEESLKPKRAS